jgi:hypothetical protein
LHLLNLLLLLLLLLLSFCLGSHKLHLAALQPLLNRPVQRQIRTDLLRPQLSAGEGITPEPKPPQVRHVVIEGIRDDSVSKRCAFLAAFTANSYRSPV